MFVAQGGPGPRGMGHGAGPAAGRQGRHQGPRAGRGAGAGRGQGPRMGMRGAGIEVTPESAKIWKSLEGLMVTKHRAMWELFTLQDKDNVDEDAVRVKRTEIRKIEVDIQAAHEALSEYRKGGPGHGQGQGAGARRGAGQGRGAGRGLRGGR